MSEYQLQAVSWLDVGPMSIYPFQHWDPVWFEPLHAAIVSVSSHVCPSCCVWKTPSPWSHPSLVVLTIFLHTSPGLEGIALLKTPSLGLSATKSFTLHTLWQWHQQVSRTVLPESFQISTTILPSCILCNCFQRTVPGGFVLRGDKHGPYWHVKRLAFHSMRASDF